METEELVVEKSIGIARRNRPLQALLGLLEALERRVPRADQRGERQIGGDSAELDARASDRIRTTRHELLDRENAEIGRAPSVMTDDGGPVPACADDGVAYHSIVRTDQ